MPITFVQSAQGSGLSAVLSPAPAQGDILIAFGWNQSAVPGTASGWTQINNLNASTWDAACVYKVAGAGESTTQTPFTTTSCNVSIVQFHSTLGSFSVPVVTVKSSKQGTAAAPPTVTSTAITPAKGENVLLISCYANSAADPAPSAITSMVITLTLSGGTTGTGVTAYVINNATSSTTKTATWTGSASATPGIFAVSFYETIDNQQTGSITPAGTTAKKTLRALTGSSTIAGVISRFITALQSGSLTDTGTVAKFISDTVLAGSISIAGAYSRFVSVIFSGASTLTSAISSILSGGGTQYTQSLSGSMTGTSGWGPTVTAAILTGAVTAAGTLTRSVNAIYTGSITLAGTVAKVSGSLLAGSLSQTGTIFRRIGALLSGSLTDSGTDTRAVSVVEAGSVTASGGILKTASLFFTGSVTETGSLKRLTSIALNGSLTSSGTVNRFIQLIALGSVTLQGAVAAGGQTFHASFSGSLAPAGSIGKMISRALTAAIAAVKAFASFLFARPGVTISLPIVQSVSMSLPVANSFRTSLPVVRSAAVSLPVVNSASLSLPVVSSITLSLSEA